LPWSKMLKHLTDAGSQGSFLACSLCKVQHDKFAFTLAEVLITIGIIGVVAAMTIPNLMQKYQEKVFVNKLRETHSIFSQAFKLATAEYDGIEGWDINNNQKLYDYFKPFLKLGQDCGTKKGCFYKGGYKALFNDEFAQNLNISNAKGRLLNGVSFNIWSAGSCKRTDGFCGSILIDLNGLSKPNKAGVDLFALKINKDSITPPKPEPNGWMCEFNNPSKYNGVYCTKWVIDHGNMDYLRRDISNEQ